MSAAFAQPFAPLLAQPLPSAMFALEVPYWVSSAIKLGLVALIIPTAALVLGYVFLLKMMSFMQSRLGPMEAGPYGTLQLLADGIKFLQKEDIFPEKADRTVFALAPLVVLISTFLIYVVIPAGPNAVVAQLDVGIFYALAVSSLSVVGILMAGWASSNKYALVGGLRAAGQLIAYELPLVVAVMGVVIQAGTLDLQKIVTAQAQGEIFGWDGIGNPFILTQFVGFFIFLVAVQAELTQPPFDMPVAESEIVGGYQVEYTGFRFLFFFMGEFGTAFAFAALAAVMFLGGWALPWGDITHWGFNIAGPVILLVKVLAVATLIFWFRFTYPRLREDQLQRLAWKFLIPLALANIVVTGIFKVVF
ncbi:MAG: NADH-quinone oxidoreductase subunit NuoH [bacterium]|nr:NADH-quinone oxidoreductase subunit NuoH [bacterium]